MPKPMPKAMTKKVTPEVTASKALSLFALPGDGSIKTRRVAVMVADGCDRASVTSIAERLTAEGAVPRFVSATLGAVKPASGADIEVDISIEAGPSVLYDALVLPGGAGAVRALSLDGQALEFIKDQYRHCKPILAFDDGANLLAACGIPVDAPDTGIVTGKTGGQDSSRKTADQFIAAMAKHRHFGRESNPPRV
jgi:catalase